MQQASFDPYVFFTQLNAEGVEIKTGFCNFFADSIPKGKNHRES